MLPTLMSTTHCVVVKLSVVICRRRSYVLMNYILYLCCYAHIKSVHVYLEFAWVCLGLDRVASG